MFLERIEASFPQIKFHTLLPIFLNYCFLFQNECSFVSLRDVERAMKVIVWFCSNSELINEVIAVNARDEESESSEESSEDEKDGSDESDDDVKQVRQDEQVRFLKFFHLLHEDLIIKQKVNKENGLEIIPFCL